MGILAHTSRHQSALTPNRGLEALGPLGGGRMDYSLIGMGISTCEAGWVRVAVKCVGGLAVNIRG